MARNDDSQRGTGAPSRVYKPSDVHKRRIDRKGRHKRDAQAPAPAVEEAAREARSPSLPQPSSALRQDESGKEAVVITPEFGKRAEARRVADDRWFQALRESDASGESAAAQEQADPLGESPTEEIPTVDAAGEPVSGKTPSAPEGQSFKSESAEPAEAVPAESDARALPAEGGGSGQQAADSPQHPARGASRKLPLKPAQLAVAIVGVVVLVAAIVLVSLFAWNRWYRYDDHADMQGMWYVAGTTVPVTIDATSIHLTDDVTYSYEIDAHDKTIKYTFGPMAGGGRYWFSDDRQYLVITDGDTFDGTSTAIDDVLHQLSDAGGAVTGAGAKLPEGEGIIAFSREPDAAALEREQAEAARKAAEEEAARKAAEEEAARIAAEEAAEVAAWEAYSYEETVEQPPAEQPPAEEAPAEGQKAEEG